MCIIVIHRGYYKCIGRERERERERERVRKLLLSKLYNTCIIVSEGGRARTANLREEQWEACRGTL